MSIFGEPFDEQQYEAQARETDELLARLEARTQVQKSFSDGVVIRKTYTTPPAAQPQSMDEAIVDDLTDYFGKLTSEMVDDERRKMHEHVASETAKLREEIAGLRCDIEILRVHKAGNVTPIKGDRDAA